MKWLTETTITLTPLALGIFLLVALAVGWTLYAIRGYEYWYRRFHRYARFSRKAIEKGHSYVEHVPEIEQLQVAPKTRSAYIKTKKPTPPEILESEKDDLQVIEGIGPKIEEILNQSGISTWKSLSRLQAKDIHHILARAGKRFQMHDPATWPKQANLAENAQWDELRKWQDILDGGVMPSKKA